MGFGRMTTEVKHPSRHIMSRAQTIKGTDISVWTHGYLSYALDYNQYYFILLLKCFQIWCWEFFLLASVSLWHTLFIVEFWGVFLKFVLNTFLLTGTVKCSRLTLYIFCPSARISQGTLVPFIGEWH